METLTNAASTASRMIFGDKNEQSGQEPISGHTGMGTADQPYDAGNMEGNPSLSGTSAQEQRTHDVGTTTDSGSNHDKSTTDDSSKKGSAPSTERPSSNYDASSNTGSSAPTSAERRGSDTVGRGDPSNPTGGVAQGINTAGAVRPEHQTDKTGVTGIHSNDPAFRDVRPTEAGEDRRNVNAGGFGTAEPSAGADPRSAQKPEQKQQGGDKPLEEPAGKQASAVSEKKDEAEQIMAKKDPNDHSGEPMKIHDGRSEAERRASVTGQEGGGVHGKETGTGEKYIKSTGLQAEGGDFDAARAGAGREARRILDQKGIGQAGENTAGASTDHTTNGESEDTSTGSKASIGEKIKNKLHVGKH